MRVARRVVEQADADEAIGRLLDRFTIYVIPRPSPDAGEQLFDRPLRERNGNLRPTDDDRDGTAGEDPPDDLNGDGCITMMRVADDTGRWMLHPDDPRVLIEADPKKNERGAFKLYIEGRDDDGDRRWNEDAGDGVALSRNFPFAYPYFQAGAGPHAVSEVESRALADFCYDRPHIAHVVTFTTDDNLLRTPKPNAQAERNRIKTTLLGADAPLVEHLAKQFRELADIRQPPEPTKSAGGFAAWSYFHFGRWSWASRGWHVPPTPDAKPDEKNAEQPAEKQAKEDAEEPQDETDDDKAEKEQAKEPDKKKPPEKRGADQIRALKWLAAEGIDGFVDWTPVEHPDFPDRQVEVGGFRPLVRLNPPANQLDAIAERHVRLLGLLAEHAPTLRVRPAKVEPLGQRVFRITATVVNDGYLPTMPQMGKIARAPQPVQIELQLPEGTEWIQGPRRVQLEPLAGNGGSAERVWIVRTPQGEPTTGTIRAWAPAVGQHRVEVQLSEP